MQFGGDRKIKLGIFFKEALVPKLSVKNRVKMFEPRQTFVAVPLSSIQVFRENSSSTRFSTRSMRVVSCRPKAKNTFPLSPLSPCPMKVKPSAKQSPNSSAKASVSGRTVGKLNRRVAAPVY